MNHILHLADSWPVRFVVIGGLLLLVGRIFMLVLRQPARRAALGIAAVAAALFVIPLALLPGWLAISLPAQTNDETVVHANDHDVAIVAQNEAPSSSDVAVPRSEEREEIVLAPAGTGTELQGPVGDKTTASGEVTTTPTSEVPGRTYGFVPMVVIAYAVGVAALLARLLIGHLGLARLWRLAHPAPEWVEQLFRQLAATTCPQAQIRVSAKPIGPVCFGILRPRVLLPASMLTTNGRPAIECILAHELGHLSRRDPFWGMLLGIARSLYFVLPWFAGLRREIRLAQEQLADADAARRASTPADYAELLIRMNRSQPAPLGAAGVRGTTSELYRRVTMLLKNSGRVESRCPKTWKFTVAAGLAGLAIVTAGLYVRPGTVEAAEPDKKQAPKPDPIKELIEKLKKDAGDDPEKAKQIEELEKSLKPKKPEALPGSAPVPPPPVAVPRFLDPELPEDELLKELLQGQEQLLKQFEQMLGQMQAGKGLGFGIGPDGEIKPLRTATGGGRLGIRVEKPSDVLASQLDLPNGQGLVCVDVPAESNAGKIGLKPHDILLEVGGKAVPNDVPTFVNNLKDIKPDTAVDIVVLRKGRKETIKGVKIPEAKEVVDAPAPLFPQLPGFKLEAIPLPADVQLPPPPLPIQPGGAGAEAKAGPGESIRVEQVNDAFTIFYSKNGVKVTIAGSRDGGVPKAESIEVDDNGKTAKAESIEELPKEYQDLATSAMKAIR